MERHSASSFQVMNCPKCFALMIPVSFNGIEVDRCSDCQGLWFDEFKMEELEKLRGSQKLDIGDAELGRQFNRVDMIDCPRCGSRMLRMVDRKQHHIWFEHCTVCGGSFLDAGEFRDLKHRTVAGFFKDLMTEARK